MQTTVIWLSLFVLFLVIEIITMGLTTIWFAGGALVAFLVAVLGLGLGVQIIIFVEVRGQEWAAKTDAPEGKIPKNAIVVVEGIQGVKLIVRNGEETKI